MEASYRRSLIAQEILGYNADIVCLQEVDEKAFFTYFRPVMQHAGAPHMRPARDDADDCAFCEPATPLLDLSVGSEIVRPCTGSRAL